jgi:hypothetical protein
MKHILECHSTYLDVDWDQIIQRIRMAYWLNGMTNINLQKQLSPYVQTLMTQSNKINTQTNSNDYNIIDNV